MLADETRFMLHDGPGGARSRRLSRGEAGGEVAGQLVLLPEDMGSNLREQPSTLLETGVTPNSVTSPV